MRKEPFKLTLVTDLFFPGLFRRIQCFLANALSLWLHLHVQAEPSCLLHTTSSGSALRNSWLHLVTLIPTRGRQWSAASPRNKHRDVRHFPPCPLPLFLLVGPPNHFGRSIPPPGQREEKVRMSCVRFLFHSPWHSSSRS